MDEFSIKAIKAFEITFAEYEKKPVDLLNIGDIEGERSYLSNARLSYERTIRDIARVLAEKPAGKKPGKILEIGAYMGVVSISLARLGFQVTALDIPEFMSNLRLQERYQQQGVAFVSTNLRGYSLPLSSCDFDLVVMCETLEHLNFNPLPVLGEINRILRPEGQLYLALPNLASLPNRFNLLLGKSNHNPIADFQAQLSLKRNMIVGIHWREYTRKELIELLSAGGFRIERHAFENTSAACFPARLLYRFFPSLRSGQTVIARKEREADWDFHFTAASWPV